MAAMERSILLELPEDVIYHIFSHLTNQDVIRLSRVSKRLLGLVQKRPNLGFDHTEEYDEEMIFPQEELEYTRSTLARYRRQDIHLQTFTLKAHWLVKRHEDNYRCIELAAKPGLRNLNLWMGGFSHDNVLPGAFFEVESLVELELKNFRLKPTTRRVAWPNLKRLSLLYCLVEQELLENITRGCPLIEILEVETDYSPCKFKVANLHYLKQLNLKLSPYHCLEVRAVPNLESIVCHSAFLILDDTEYPNLTTLDLHSGGIDGHFFTDFVHKFPKLEKLCLTCTQLTLQIIILSSTSLKEIELSNMEALEEAYFDVPNLVRFKYACRNAHIRSLPKLSFAGNSGGWSSCIELNEQGENIDFFAWFMELNEFLVGLIMSETSITVRFNKVQVSFNHANSVIFAQGIRELIMNNNIEALQEACFDVANIVCFKCSRDNRNIHDEWSSCIELHEYKSNINLSWFLELNEFLSALNGFKTSITVKFHGARPRVLFDEVPANQVISPCSIREFSINTNWFKFSTSSASAILECIFLICQPQTITLVDCKSYEIRKRFYEQLTSTTSQDHHGRVTDFGMFRSGTRFKFKDWDRFQEVFHENKGSVKNISFHLEYRSQGVQNFSVK